jgi:hypothetical protein
MAEVTSSNLVGPTIFREINIALCFSRWADDHVCYKRHSFVGGGIQLGWRAKSVPLEVGF